MAEMIDSTSDGRTVNNVMRHQYPVLTDEEKQQMLAIKDEGMVFYKLLHTIGGTGSIHEDSRQASRYLSLAQTAIEEAVMWATKHITGDNK